MQRAIDACREALASDKGVIAITGAGVSAESGIPTFRGKEGYWTVGAREYHPQELATWHAFSRMPWDVWAWYLYRRGVCRAAQPNAGHTALVRLDRALQPGGRTARIDDTGALHARFALITQNVDGLHRRAGSPEARTLPIHGDIDQMRCAAECVPDRWPIPEEVPALAKGEPVSPDHRALLVCPRCSGMTRPHVLWFDETYNEIHFHFDTARRLGSTAQLVILVGTSGQTNLPAMLVSRAHQLGSTIIDINLEDNPFTTSATASVRAPAATALPTLVDAVI